MKSAQAHILGMVEERIEKRNLVAIQAAAFSNTGSILIYRQLGKQALGSIHYDFQADAYKLSITVAGRRIPSQIGRAGYFDFYQKYDEPTRFWDALAEALAEMVKAPSAAKALAN